MTIRSRYDQISSVEIQVAISYREDVTKYGSTHVSQNISTYLQQNDTSKITA
jgi:hypothetical protein